MRMCAAAVVAWWALGASVVAQEPGGALLGMYRDMARVSEGPVSLQRRAEMFSALGALPADTRSFFAIRGLGALCSSIAGADAPAGFPLAALGSQLDGFAVGMSEAAAQDLQRLMPLFNAMDSTRDEAVEKWLEQAGPDASLAIVAQQREARRQTGEQLVAATRELRLAPIYMALSCKPEGQLLLYQLTALMYLLPLEPDGPMEWVVQGQNRGICLRGDKLDLSGLELEPEHEQQLRVNLRNVRLYIMMQVVQNHLVVALASDQKDIRWIGSPADSVLNTGSMAAYDALMQRDALALGQADEALVKLRDGLNLQSYRSVAQFVGGVFTRLAGEYGAAAGAMERLVKILETLIPPRKGAEQLMVWKDEDYYAELVVDACGQYFEPGTLRHLAAADAPGTVLYAESTMPGGLPAVELKQVAEDVQQVQNSFISTMKPECRAVAQMNELPRIQPCLVPLAAGLQSLGPAVGDGVALLVQEHAGATVPQQAAAISLRASVKDAAALAAAGQKFREAGEFVVSKMSDRERCEVQEHVMPYVQVAQSSDAILLHNGAGGLTLAAPQTAAPVEGGLVFSLHLPELERVVTTINRLENPGKPAEYECRTTGAAQELERIDGAARVLDGRLKMRVRLCPVKK